MRLVLPGEHPSGLYQDEAVNGLDALDVLAGRLPLYFEANNGREPLFIYLVAAGVGVFGRTPLGIRSAGMLVGLLTLPATYLLGATWTGRRTGLLAAAILAMTLWHVHLSRIGFRAVSLPLFSALALGLGAWALQARSRLLAALAGVAYGLSFYTYLAVRFTPLALAGILIYGLIWHRAWLRERWPLIGLAGLATLITLLPLIGVAAARPEMVLGRSDQVALWSRADFAPALLSSALRTLGMFTWRGDGIWRHNVPGRPVFDPLLAAIFATGVAAALAGWQRRPALAVSCIWVAVMSLPTVLADDAPHFLRAVGVLPVAALIPAIAIDDGLRWLETHTGATRRRSIIIHAAVVALLALSGTLTARDYFGCRPSTRARLSGFSYTGCYRSDPVRGYFFQEAAAVLAGDINTAPGAVYLDRRYWETFPSVQFLVNRSDLQLYGSDQPPELAGLPATVFAWPHENLAAVQASLPPAALIEARPGPRPRGARAPEPNPAPPAARFENGMALLDAGVSQQGRLLTVALYWYVDSPPIEAEPRTFVHLVGPDGRIAAQADEPPGGSFYPPLSWSQGSVIIQRVDLPLPDADQTHWQIRIGLYNPATMARLGLLQTTMAHQEDAVVLPLPGESHD